MSRSSEFWGIDISAWSHGSWGKNRASSQGRRSQAERAGRRAGEEQQSSIGVSCQFCFCCFSSTHTALNRLNMQRRGRERDRDRARERDSKSHAQPGANVGDIGDARLCLGARGALRERRRGDASPPPTAVKQASKQARESAAERGGGGEGERISGLFVNPI